MAFCTNCGKELDENNVCPNCGTKKEAEVTEEVVETVSATNVSAGGKSKIAAGILGIFLGGFGVHNFYLGYTGKAIAQLLITLLSCGLLAFISSIWGFIEGILILTGNISVDAQGNPLSD